MKKQVCLWIIGVLLWIPFQFVEAQQHGRVKKEIAIQLYSVRDLINGVNQQGKASEVYLQTLKKLADMGYTAIEAACVECRRTEKRRFVGSVGLVGPMHSRPSGSRNVVYHFPLFGGSQNGQGLGIVLHLF